MLTIYEGKFTRLKDDRDNLIKAKEALELADPGERGRGRERESEGGREREREGGREEWSDDNCVLRSPKSLKSKATIL